MTIPLAVFIENMDVTPFHISSILIFALAIIHTLFANHFTILAKYIAKKHDGKAQTLRVSFTVEILQFLGEVEVAFALWSIPLLISISAFYNWSTAIDYLNSRSYIEPLFVVVVMCIASTRPIVKIAEFGVHGIAKLLGGSLGAWWFTVLTLGPVLGSFITEVGAMTLCALILERRFYAVGPSKPLAYATLGVLFTNISVGGLFTNYAAPCVLIVSHQWGWDSSFMFMQFGWKSLVGIIIANGLYYFIFRKEFKRLSKLRSRDVLDRQMADKKGPIPVWIAAVHVFVLVWMVFNSHFPAMFIGTFLLFLGFYQATRIHQAPLNIKRPLLVGLFLSGLVIHGGLQGWWITKILGDLTNQSVILAGLLLTAFNDNAAITYLATLIPNLTTAFQYSLVATAVAGGGLTVIANAPNPIGQMVLKEHFKKGISPFHLLLAALLPTFIFLMLFFFIRSV